MRRVLPFVVLVAGVASAASGQGTGGPSDPLRHPSPAELAKQGPDSFTVRFLTTRGAFSVRVRRSWAPKGADRMFHLVQARYYDGVTFFRVIPGFMAQAGFHGDPAVTAAWDPLVIPDDPVKHGNTRGTFTFATRGRNTRTNQFFINYVDNSSKLDGQGFAPIGQVIDGMKVVDSLYSEYGEGYPMGDGPSQDRITQGGNAYLKKAFPKLDAIISATIAANWPAPASTKPAVKPAAKKP